MCALSLASTFPPSPIYQLAYPNESKWVVSTMAWLYPVLTIYVLINEGEPTHVLYVNGDWRWYSFRDILEYRTGVPVERQRLLNSQRQPLDVGNEAQLIGDILHDNSVLYLQDSWGIATQAHQYSGTTLVNSVGHLGDRIESGSNAQAPLNGGSHHFKDTKCDNGYLRQGNHYLPGGSSARSDCEVQGKIYTGSDETRSEGLPHRGNKYRRTETYHTSNHQGDVIEKGGERSSTTSDPRNLRFKDTRRRSVDFQQGNQFKRSS
ncbi:hypothetical protein EDB80DRAFT_117405 [Ilyonectria destructans]|nr:hypothetical protein EDB80DRAFT_117405 [Ilyonectria destructans]